jgi:alkylhydroperoxidase/carboxymuconolactone decarboxylase family protein YurZ
MTAGSLDTHDLLAAIAAGGSEVLEGVMATDDARLEANGLESRVVALVRLAVLFALDGPPASYADQVASAIEAGATPDEIACVLLAVAPQVGGPRVVAAAPELMLALGMTLPELAE